MTKYEEIAGEHALRSGEKDRLGFSEIAERIASSIIDRPSKDGLVIGLDGEWGSGKSSLLHLIERSLDKLPTKKQPTIINFRPWLVGDRDALLKILFNDLADKIAHVHLNRGDTAKTTRRKAQKISASVRKFGKVLAEAGDLLEPFDAIMPGVGIVGKVTSSVGKVIGKDQKPQDLGNLKEKISQDLRDLGHRFIIAVDDVDRLEPKEVIEVLRLVRSVADFPNIIYLLCYDAERVAEAITSGAKVANGAAYLEKIVQLTVMLPKPEPFELRQWFQEDLQDILGSVSEDVRDRLRTVIDKEGGYQLRTPRAVVRALDSIRFFWPALREEKIDIADLVWIQLLKDNSPKLYRWVEGYVASVASISFGTAAVSDSETEEHLKQLIEVVSDNRLGDQMYRYMLAELLPGVEISYGDTEPPLKLYQSVDATERQRAMNCRRLASPDHYRLYFSLTRPTHAVTQFEYDSFWAAVDTSPGHISQFILKLHLQTTLGSLRKSDVLFERLRGLEAKIWSSQRAGNLLLGLGQAMDSAFKQVSTETNFIVDSWDRADRLIPIMYACLNQGHIEAINRHFFKDSPSLGWLTSILRREIFAHGKFGDDKKRREEWWIPEAQFEKACQIMIDRYRSTNLTTILETPRPIHIFFAWKQAGDEQGVQDFLKNSIENDQGLIDVLGIFTTSVVTSNRGSYTVLKREYVSAFLDYDLVMHRLTNIKDCGIAELSGRAMELINMSNRSKYTD